MDDILEDKPQSSIIHVGTNDLTNDANLLNNVKTKKKSPNIAISFSYVIIRKDRNNLENLALIQTQGLQTFVSKKNIGLIDNENLKDNHLGIKKLHLNRKGNTLFTKNLLNFIEGN